MVLVFVACGRGDEIDLSGTWTRQSCIDTTRLNTYVIRGDSLFAQ